MARLTTPVREQPLGDERCIAYAVAAGMETSICRDRRTVVGVPEISVDDLFIEGGEEIGAIDGIKEAVEDGGVVDATCFPAAAAKRCANPAPHLWKCGIRAIGGPKNKRVELMRTQLRTNGPIVALIKIFSNFVDFTGTGIYIPDGKKPSFHAVCVIGDEVEANGVPGHWIIKNSMGEDWGDAGFCRIQWHDPLVSLESVVFVVEKVHQ